MKSTYPISHALSIRIFSLPSRENSPIFGGCTIIGGLDGSYLSPAGLQIQDRINLIYTDAQHSLEGNFETISAYADKLKSATFAALEEDVILVAVMKIFHAE